MGTLLNDLVKEMVFWMAWIIIPFIMEIIPAIYGFVILIKKKLLSKKDIIPVRLPEITLIIPVYNSSSTLRGCLESVYLSNYPNELITIFLVNNQSPDNSFDVFCTCQGEFSELSMQWLNAKQGKSRALNMAVFNSQGKYIINIDSDGKLEKDAINNMVLRFEQNSNIDCLTGAILIDPELIENTEGFMLRFLRRCEMFEYGQSFLAGKNFESEMDSIFTISGAFSAFRKSVILKTQLYNTDTVCEDAHVTFQVRKLLKRKVHLCENALFFVDPIDNFNKLYTQRQRWQRGEIEVAHMFFDKEVYSLRGVFKSFMMRLMMFDHTFAFPRMIWYFALICLTFLNYPMKLIVGSVIILYSLYVFCAFLYFINISLYLIKFKAIRKYYMSKWYIMLFFPMYNFILFWIRLAGIINSITARSSWKTRTLSEEWKKVKEIIGTDFFIFSKVRKKIKEVINND